MSKKTLVLGATENRGRYANLATRRLVNNKHEVVPLGIKRGEIAGVEILTGRPHLTGVDTVTLYLNPMRQEAYYDYILSLKPKRIIFNPGTENPELVKLAREHGIETIFGCTLVMLSTGTY